MSCEKVHANHAILDLLAPAYWRSKTNCQIVKQNKRVEWGESVGRTPLNNSQFRAKSVSFKPSVGRYPDLPNIDLMILFPQLHWFQFTHYSIHFCKTNMCLNHEGNIFEQCVLKQSKKMCAQHFFSPFPWC